MYNIEYMYILSDSSEIAREAGYDTRMIYFIYLTLSDEPAGMFLSSHVGICLGLTTKRNETE